MKFNICKYRNKRLYYLGLEYQEQTQYIDNEIATVLDIPLEKYVEILMKNGVVITQYSDGANMYEFEKRKNIVNCIRDLEPYLMMKNLVGD